MPRLTHGLVVMVNSCLLSIAIAKVLTLHLSDKLTVLLEEVTIKTKQIQVETTVALPQTVPFAVKHFHWLMIVSLFNAINAHGMNSCLLISECNNNYYFH